MPDAGTVILYNKYLYYMYHALFNKLKAFLLSKISKVFLLSLLNTHYCIGNV